MDFRTIVKPEKPSFNISYASKIISIGSCFSVNMAQKLSERKFQVVSNPNGITYNPLSISHSLERLLKQQPYTETELFFHQEQWNSYEHHSDFSHAEKLTALNQINTVFTQAHNFLQTADVLLITLGSAYYYQLNETNRVVNNCHKMPDKIFSQKLMSVAEVVESLSEVFQKMKLHHPNIRFILAVSPVRYLKYGAAKNSWSKSILIEACHALSDKFSEANYFPSYEIMMDDLRDYRFYAADMIHPNEQAIDYIWQQFEQTCMAASAQKIIGSIEKVMQALQHRPRNPQSAAHKNFLAEQLKSINTILAQEPSVDFSEEMKQIREPSI